MKLFDMIKNLLRKKDENTEPIIHFTDREFFEKCNEVHKLREENNRLETRLHKDNLILCDDCIYAAFGKCASLFHDGERLDKKECNDFKRPIKRFSRCNHDLVNPTSERFYRETGFRYICLYCGRLFMGDEKGGVQ